MPTADSRAGTSSTVPAGWLAATTVVLFDLDGTLHDDPRVTEHYARTLEQELPGGRGEGLRAEVEAVVARQHPSAAPGRFVEPIRGLVLDAPDWSVVAATDWAGRPVPVPDDLRGPVGHDGPLRYLGDRWQVVGAVAVRRGATAGALSAAFRHARCFANDPSTQLVRLARIDDVLARLSPGRRFLLATNTPRELAEPLVHRLELRHPFAVTRYDAGKPAGCTELVEEVTRMWGMRPEEVLVVGDNLWNDLLPLAARGCVTVHIDPLVTDPTGRWSSARFPDLTSFAVLLETLPHAI